MSRLQAKCRRIHHRRKPDEQAFCTFHLIYAYYSACVCIMYSYSVVVFILNFELSDFSMACVFFRVFFSLIHVYVSMYTYEVFSS